MILCRGGREKWLYRSSSFTSAYRPFFFCGSMHCPPGCYKHPNDSSHSQTVWVWSEFPVVAWQTLDIRISLYPQSLFVFSTFQTWLFVIVLLSSEHAGATCHPFYHLTKCGFHLSNMVWISPPRWAAFSSFHRCELDYHVQMPARLQGELFICRTCSLTVSQQPSSQVHYKL